MTGDRNRELDVLKSFGIFLMIFDHVGWGNLTHTYIQSFHMPLFFIVSGYLWKPYQSQSATIIAQRRFRKIMVPYFSFAVLYMLIMMCVATVGMTDRNIALALRAVLLYPTDMQNMPFAPALWFLPCFYLCNLIYTFLTEKLGKNKWIVIVILAVAGFTYSTLSDNMLPFTIEPLMVTPLFVLIGELIKNNRDVVFSWLDRCWVMLILFALDGILVYGNGSCDLRSARYHNCALYIIDAVVGTMLMWSITRKVLKIPTGKILMSVSYLSIYSISFLCMNQFVIMLFERLFSSIMSNSSLIIEIVQKCISLIMTIIVCIAMNELIKNTRLHFMIGR